MPTRAASSPTCFKSPARRWNSRSAPGPPGRAILSRTRPCPRPFQRVTRAIARARRAARLISVHRSAFGGGLFSMPAGTIRFVGVQPPMPKDESNTARSIAMATASRLAGSDRKPSPCANTSPNNPVTGSSWIAPRDRPDTSTSGKSSILPPSTASASPRLKRSTAFSAGSERNCNLRARLSHPSIAGSPRFSGSIGVSVTTGPSRCSFIGPPPSPLRKSPSSGCAISCSSSGCGRDRRSSTTRPVITRISSIFARSSAKGVPCKAPSACRSAVRANSAVIGLPSGQSPARRRKM